MKFLIEFVTRLEEITILPWSLENGYESEGRRPPKPYGDCTCLRISHSICPWIQLVGTPRSPWQFLSFFFILNSVFIRNIICLCCFRKFTLFQLNTVLRSVEFLHFREHICAWEPKPVWQNSVVCHHNVKWRRTKVIATYSLSTHTLAPSLFPSLPPSFISSFPRSFPHSVTHPDTPRSFSHSHRTVHF